MKFLYTIWLVLIKNLTDLGKVIVKCLHYLMWFGVCVLVVYSVFALIGFVEYKFIPDITQTLFGLQMNIVFNNQVINNSILFFAFGILSMTILLFALLLLVFSIIVVKMLVIDGVYFGVKKSFNFFKEYIVDKWKKAKYKAELKFSIYR